VLGRQARRRGGDGGAQAVRELLQPVHHHAAARAAARQQLAHGVPAHIADEAGAWLHPAEGGQQREVRGALRDGLLRATPLGRAGVRAARPQLAELAHAVRFGPRQN